MTSTLAPPRPLLRARTALAMGVVGAVPMDTRANGLLDALERAVAVRLFLSVNTVKSYIRSAYRKIGVTRRAQAVWWAVHHDLAHLPVAST